MNKLTIPTILGVTLLLAGMFAFMPVEKATTTHASAGGVPGSVTSTSIADGTIVTADLADNSVTNAKMADNAVGNAEMLDNAITTTEIAADTIDDADVVNDGLDGTSLADTLTVDIILDESAGGDIIIQANDKVFISGTGGTGGVSIRAGQGAGVPAVDEVLIIGDAEVELAVDAGGVGVKADLGTAVSTVAVCAAANGGGIQELRDCSGAPAADYAEHFPVAWDVEYGDIVVLGRTALMTIDGDNLLMLVKSSKPYDNAIIGVVSNNYGDFTSAGYNIDEADNPMPIALVGRVPVKVTNENGPIQPGDLLTTSSTPGHAMKFELLKYTGMEDVSELIDKLNENEQRRNAIIGMALEPFNGKAGQVMVFLKYR